MLALLALAIAPLMTPAGIAAQAEASGVEAPAAEQRPVCFPGVAMAVLMTVLRGLALG